MRLHTFIPSILSCLGIFSSTGAVFGYIDPGYEVYQVSAGTASAMHGYMDICPESPNGERITYFEFEDKVPGWGHVVVANRDGSNPQYVSKRIKGHDHDGARQQWISDEKLIYRVEGTEGSEVYDLATKTTLFVKGEIGMVSEIHGLGLSHNNYPSSQYKGSERKSPEVLLMNISQNSLSTLFRKEEMVPLNPARSILETPKYHEIGGIKHPKWSPDGSRFFCVYMLEDKELGKKLVKSAYLSDREGKGIKYISEIGQHPMWYTADSLLSYVRHKDFSHSDNPSAQDIMSHPIDGSSGQPIIRNALGLHGSPDPDGKYFVTDIFDWPESGTHAVLLYHIESGDYQVLVRMRSESGDTKNSMHPHPSWSRDGKRIYFNGSESGNRRLYCIDLTNFSFN